MVRGERGEGVTKGIIDEIGAVAGEEFGDGGGEEVGEINAVGEAVSSRLPSCERKEAVKGCLLATQRLFCS